MKFLNNKFKKKNYFNLFYFIKKKKKYLFSPTASISSINIIVGACSSAVLNNSLTNLGPSPKYF